MSKFAKITFVIINCISSGIMHVVNSFIYLELRTYRTSLVDSLAEKFRSSLMKHPRLSLIAACLLVLPAASMANDFSTVTRVQYVMECIQLNTGEMNIYEATHKCSCVVDKLAVDFTQREFEDANTGFQLRNMPGDRGGVFRDDADVKDGIGLFKKLHVEAYASCRLR